MSVTTIKPKLITAKEFEKFDPEWRYDLIRGELHPMPPMPGYEHGVVTADFAVAAGSYVKQHRLGKCFAAETRFLIERNPDTAIGPDWAFIARDRLPHPAPRGFAPIVPDAVLEVRSPSDTAKEVKEKVERWLAAGVRLVWELNLKTRVLTIYRRDMEPQTLGIEDTISGEDVLPGFMLPLRSLFASLDDEAEAEEAEEEKA
jgi:Uma2 family endonuclease